MLREDGQATVELIGVVPALLAVGLVLWQLILVGHAAWMSAHAARAAARADLVGEDADAAARAVVPSVLERGLEVDRDDAGRTRVEVPVPVVGQRWDAPVDIAARASLEAVP